MTNDKWNIREDLKGESFYYAGAGHLGASHRHLIEVQHVLCLCDDGLNDVCSGCLSSEVPREGTVREHHIDRLKNENVS